jgi:hypothetical protein
LFNTTQTDRAIATRDERVAKGGGTIAINYFTIAINYFDPARVARRINHNEPLFRWNFAHDGAPRENFLRS